MKKKVNKPIDATFGYAIEVCLGVRLTLSEPSPKQVVPGAGGTEQTANTTDDFYVPLYLCKLLNCNIGHSIRSSALVYCSGIELRREKLLYNLPPYNSSSRRSVH